MRSCEVREVGRICYAEADALQKELVARRKCGMIPDQLLLVEHPHVITLGRNGHLENLLASEEVLRSTGIEFFPTDRGGDITYHGPGQIIGYPIFDLREWKRDVVQYVDAIEQAIIDSLAEFGIVGTQLERARGVWVGDRKIAAIGVHVSRWVTSHGFALNHTTDLSFFEYIVPCGLTMPVTSMRELGVEVPREHVSLALVRNFQKQFSFDQMRNETWTPLLVEEGKP